MQKEKAFLYLLNYFGRGQWDPIGLKGTCAAGLPADRNRIGKARWSKPLVFFSDE